MVAKPNDTKSFAAQKIIATSIKFVSCLFKMLTAVHLDDQFCCVRNEVNNVGPDWRLTTKTNAIQTMRAQNTP